MVQVFPRLYLPLHQDTFQSNMWFFSLVTDILYIIRGDNNTLPPSSGMLQITKYLYQPLKMNLPWICLETV